MTTFTDGPAAGKTLLIKRSPYFLRVVDDGTKLDALDQVDDSPKPSETCYAYRCAKVSGAVHLNIKGGRGGFFPRAEYAFIPEQPPQAVMRSRAEWSEWCHAHAPTEEEKQKLL